MQGSSPSESFHVAFAKDLAPGFVLFDIAE